ncbi:pantoate--beta-alanine ligase [Ornithinibacillus gellani]|uniref:pantoate--beta-alanine ligase n=1 Tax=Ornithinibacillus gellani TaxID=2293253 RepID=UPI000F4922A0|nr:pantoate--beta-alanine ligase [Ornithinibacillus gellani]TQS74393.1 pantoate--beta-alanine ligase [Ornithinibacillus gellani]
MKIITSIQDMQARMLLEMQQGKKIGFVPTMGFLHEGHLSLMEKAGTENDIVVASIFVNPLQFGPNEDFETYPRDAQRDTKLAEEVGVDILFLPNVKEMYPQKQQIKLQVTDRADVLCGQSRPGHFDGVVAVLTKLFHLIQPTRVYFGLKDAQQVAVVDALIQDYNFPIELIGVPTVREADGLAKSSRNVYLSETERAQAAALFAALEKGRQLVVDGESNPVIIVEEVKEYVKQKTNGKIDYVELLAYPSLTKTTTVKQMVVLAIAVQFQHARLIDNLLFNEKGEIITTFSRGK